MNGWDVSGWTKTSDAPHPSTHAHTRPDANGLEMVARVVNQTGWGINNVTMAIAGNYYPCPSRSAVMVDAGKSAPREPGGRLTEGYHGVLVCVYVCSPYCVCIHIHVRSSINVACRVLSNHPVHAVHSSGTLWPTHS